MSVYKRGMDHLKNDDIASAVLKDGSKAGGALVGELLQGISAQLGGVCDHMVVRGPAHNHTHSL